MTRERRALAEVDLDRADTKLQQISEFPLVPLHRFRITHVERRVFKRKLPAFIPDVIPLVNHLFPEIVFAGEVSVLPETDVKTLLLQVGDHLCRIAETRRRETIIAAPISFEPTGVEMDHVRGNVVRSQLLGHVAHLVFGVVSDPAHPEPERPERRHRTATRQRCVLRQNVFRFAEEDEEVEVLVA